MGCCTACGKVPLILIVKLCSSRAFQRYLDHMILMSRSEVMVTSLGSCMMYTTLYERYEDRTSVPNIKCGVLGI